jgi:hypothetical protein
MQSWQGCDWLIWCPECTAVLGITVLKPQALALLPIIKFGTLSVKCDFMTIKKQKIFMFIYYLIILLYH